MHKGYKKTIAILVTCALIGALGCFPVSATSVSVSVPISQPNVSDNFSYVEIIAEDSNGNLNAYIILLSSFSSVDGGSADMFCTLSFPGSNDIGTPSKLRFSDRSSSSSQYLSAVYVNKNGSFDTLGTSIVNGYIDVSLQWYEIVYLRVYGNIIVSGSLSGYNQLGAAISYGTSFETNTLLSSLLSVLQNQSNADIIANANKNAQNIQDNADQNASDIQANQDSNTDKEIQAEKENTQAIIDNQNELAEQEKQEITSSGNQATDAMDNIPNESEGFINALGTFVSTMSTTDTACSITFPAIKTPSFAGIPAATLSEEHEVDFSAAISLIPSDIMKLIQALTTIALIVFCFKELYDTISEALTRKKANSDG